MHDNNSYELVLCTRPPGTAHCRRHGMILKDDTGKIVDHLVEIPADKLGGLLARFRGYHVVPSEYGFRWLATGLRHVVADLHTIREVVSDICDRLQQLQQSVESVSQRLDDRLISEVEVVLERLEDAQKLPFDEARKMFQNDVAVCALTTLKTLKKRVEAAAAAIGRSDPRQVCLLRQLVTVAGLEAKVYLLSGSGSRATEAFGNVRSMVENNARRLLEAWMAGVDLLEAFQSDEFDDLFVEMQVIDDVIPMERLKAAYTALPRTGDAENGVVHTEYETVDDDSVHGFPQVNAHLPGVDLAEAASKFRQNKRAFVRRGQAIGPVQPATEWSKAKRNVLKYDGFLLSNPEDPRRYEFLYIKGTTPPIPKLAEHIRRLSGLVCEVRAMADGVAFAAEHPDEAHDLVQESSGFGGADGIELLVRASCAPPVQRPVKADALPQLPKGEGS